MIRFLFLILFFITPQVVFARVSAEDIYQQKRAEYNADLFKVTDQRIKNLISQADHNLKASNLNVSNRFDSEINKMSAILDELKSRQGVTNTTVAFGQGDTPLDHAAYYLNFAAEAVAYQKVQDYTPSVITDNYASGITPSLNRLNSDLISTKNKVLKAKSELLKAVNYYEKQ